MPKKKRPTNNKTDIRIGNLTDISGNVNIAGGNITTHQTTTGLSAAEIKQLFDGLYSAIETRANTPVPVKQDIKAEVQEIQSTITEAIHKNETPDESFLSRRFRNIARMAPDILDVVVATLVNPALGIAVTVKKLADKARQEIN